MMEKLTSKGRTLSTAREVLRVLRFLQERPEGVSPKEVAFWIGKSLHTAYYLLNTLCQEGFALKQKDGRYALFSQPASPEEVEDLRELAKTLNRKTRCRSYLVILEGQEIYVDQIFSHQGQPKPRGLSGCITSAAHALAVGKAVLSLLGERGIDLLPEELPVFTPRTLDRGSLVAQLLTIREDGLAMDLEEYQEGLYCLAVPVRVRGAPAALGLAVSRGRFFAEGNKLATLLRGLVPREVQWYG